MENFVIIGVFVLLGILFRHLEAFPKDSAQVLNMFALYVSLPALILLKAPQIAFSREIAIAAIIPWGMLLLSALLVLAGARLWHWQRSTVGVLLLVVPLGNTSFLGIPMIQAFFGAAGLSYLIIYDQIGTMMIMVTYGSFILATYGKNGSTRLAQIVRRVLLFPPTIALLIGLAVRAWPYPEKLAQALQNVSLTLVPVVMTAIGMQMRFRLPYRVLPPLGSAWESSCWLPLCWRCWCAGWRARPAWWPMFPFSKRPCPHGHRRCAGCRRRHGCRSRRSNDRHRDYPGLRHSAGDILADEARMIPLEDDRRPEQE